jgi:hypothetical protein
VAPCRLAAACQVPIRLRTGPLIVTTTVRFEQRFTPPRMAAARATVTGTGEYNPYLPPADSDPGDPTLVIARCCSRRRSRRHGWSAGARPDSRELIDREPHPPWPPDASCGQNVQYGAGIDRTGTALRSKLAHQNEQSGTCDRTSRSRERLLSASPGNGAMTARSGGWRTVDLPAAPRPGAAAVT